MDIHKPKPWRGGAEFVKEIGQCPLSSRMVMTASPQRKFRSSAYGKNAEVVSHCAN